MNAYHCKLGSVISLCATNCSWGLGKQPYSYVIASHFLSVFYYHHLNTPTLHFASKFFRTLLGIGISLPISSNLSEKNIQIIGKSTFFAHSLSLLIGMAFSGNFSLPFKIITSLTKIFLLFLVSLTIISIAIFSYGIFCLMENKKYGIPYEDDLACKLLIFILEKFIIRQT